MTIKQYLELDKIKENFKDSAMVYLHKHADKILEKKKIQDTFNSITRQLNLLTKYFYEQ